MGSLDVVDGGLSVAVMAPALQAAEWSGARVLPTIHNKKSQKLISALSINQIHVNQTISSTDVTFPEQNVS